MLSALCVPAAIDAVARALASSVFTQIGLDLKILATFATTVHHHTQTHSLAPGHYWQQQRDKHCQSWKTRRWLLQGTSLQHHGRPSWGCDDRDHEHDPHYLTW